MLQAVRVASEFKGGLLLLAESAPTLSLGHSGRGNRALTKAARCLQVNYAARAYSSTAETQKERGQNVGAGSGYTGFHQTGRTMKSWEIHSYGGPDVLQLNEVARLPVIRHPEEILVQVKAASVNPLDVEMSRGYGAQVFQTLRQIEKGKICRIGRDNIEFPLTLGRDFAGIVVETGGAVRNVKVGDEVYGVLRFTEHGTHAEYTVARSDLVRPKPTHLSFSEAASFPYVSLTCWSALRISGNFLNLEGKRVLVLGGSGGVGTFAVQYLRAEGAEVVTTCSSDAVELLTSLGILTSHIVDYTQPDSFEKLESFSPFDCILNLSGGRSDASKYLPLLKPVIGQYITMSPPSLGNFDQYGFFFGAIKNAQDFIKNNFDSVSKDRVITKWGYFVPSPRGLKAVGDLIQKRKIQPVIDSTYSFSDLPKAYQRVAQGHLRGKVVIEV